MVSDAKYLIDSDVRTAARKILLKFRPDALKSAEAPSAPKSEANGAAS